MKLFVVCMLALVACAVSVPVFSSLGEVDSTYSFDQYMQEFNKGYSNDERELRQGIFQKNLEKINAHNANPKKTWWKAVNKFTDMTPKELSSYKGYDRAARHYPTLSSPPIGRVNGSVDDLPTEVDWRKKGVTTDVKDQGSCGSCWAFSASEVMESHIAIETGKLLQFSEQQLVSCAPNTKHCGGTGGCQGNVQWQAFDYVTSVGGITTESDYKYKARTGTCDKAEIKKVATIDGTQRLPTNDNTELHKAVADIGPIAISVAADAWFSYGGGVFGADDHSSCGTTVDHAVVAEGYGVDSSNGKDVPYWLVRNSWGSYWGEEGYIRIYRSPVGEKPFCGTDTDPSSGSGCSGGPKSVEVCGVCGILSDSSYPTGGRLL